MQNTRIFLSTSMMALLFSAQARAIVIKEDLSLAPGIQNVSEEALRGSDKRRNAVDDRGEPVVVQLLAVKSLGLKAGIINPEEAIEGTYKRRNSTLQPWAQVDAINAFLVRQIILQKLQLRKVRDNLRYAVFPVNKR